MSKVIPVLRIFDLDKAKEFYINWLGFKIDWEHRFGDNFPIYLQVSKDDLQFHLTEHYGDCTPGAKVFIHYSDLKQFHAAISAKDYRYYKPCIEEAPWNAITMELTDPFGNKLLFNQSR